MKKEQLADIIGNINEEFIHESDARKSYIKANEDHHLRRPRRLVAMVAVVALMVASFAVGTFAATRSDTSKVHPAEEFISMDGMNIKLILPDEWEDKYVMENLSSADNPGCFYGFYQKDVYEKYLEDQKTGTENWFQGRIFILARMADEPLTPKEVEEQSPVPCKYLFATDDATYIIAFASDVQVDPEDEDAANEYRRMREQASDISFILPSLID